MTTNIDLEEYGISQEFLVNDEDLDMKVSDKKIKMPKAMAHAKAREEVDELEIEKGRLAALRKVSMDYYLRVAQEDPMLLTTSRKVHSMLEYLEETKAKKVEQKFFLWITVNPQPNTMVETLVKAVEKLVAKSWITFAVYCFEQRSEEKGKYNGIHAHILVNRNGKPPCEYEREIFNTFKKMVGNKKHVHIVPLTKEQGLGKIPYMKGNKEKEKRAKCVNDINFRMENNLKNLYIVNKLEKVEKKDEE